MAEFCVATGYTPQQFWEMTLEEYEHIVRALNKRSN